jgi:hypothetical protein
LATATAWCTARDLGVISPKKRMRKVMTPVATPTPAEPKASVATSVTRAVAAMFTRLLPTRMVVRKRVMSWENLPGGWGLGLGQGYGAEGQEEEPPTGRSVHIP